MPKYSFVAKTNDSKTVKDIEFASSQDEMVAKLRARGLFIVSIKEIIQEKVKGTTASDVLNKKRGKRTSIKLHDLTMLARNLAVTLSSGITLLRSLEILAKQAESGKMQQVLQECGTYVREGLSFSEAIHKYPKIFPSLWQSIVEVGEASGNLPFGLDKLADYLEMRMDFERKIKSALIYPVILVCVSFLALLIFFKVILPKFTELFSQFNIELPLPTKIVFGISAFVAKYWLLIILGIVVTIAAFIYFKDDPQFKKAFDKISLKVPLVNKIVLVGCLERFTSTMYILLDSGLPLVYTLDASARGIGNYVLEKELMAVKERVREGASLSDEIGKLDVFPALIPEMAKVGEETGSMPEVFSKVSSYYQKELSTKVERIVLVFEPLMITVMGFLIGGIVISLFLPIFKIATAGV
ncbi:MAG: type II secretion system F family protein [Candidatus Omnitrophica bacterium]|nr:type II secretion system F family protein [Candidatus Omnitrophota bacterium]